VTDGIRSIDAYTSRLGAMTPQQRDSLRISMGPIESGWDQWVRMRLTEQLVHEWDVAVALDPDAVLAEDGTVFAIDNLELIARFTGRSDGAPRRVTVSTTDPERVFAVSVAEDHSSWRLRTGSANPPSQCQPKRSSASSMDVSTGNTRRWASLTKATSSTNSGRSSLGPDACRQGNDCTTGVGICCRRTRGQHDR